MKTLLPRKFLLVSISSIFLLSACKKGLETHLDSSLAPSLQVETTVDLFAIASTFLNDSTFALVIEKVLNNSVETHQILGAQGGSPAVAEHDSLINSSPEFEDMINFYDSLGVDTSEVLTRQAEIFAVWLQLLDENPEFAELSLQDQLWVIDNVKDTLRTETFRLENPNNILVQKFEDIISIVSTDPEIIENGLTWGEVVECAANALGGAITSGWGTLRNLYNVITGYNLGWRGILNVAKSALGTLMHANAAGAAIGFGICVAGSAIF